MNDLSGTEAGTQVIVAATGDPLRSRLLILLGTAGPIGAAEIARRLEEPVQRIRRHLNVLCSQGLADVSEEVQRRGTLKRLYVLDRDLVIGEEEDSRLSEADRRRSTLGVLRLIFEEAKKAAANPWVGARSDRVAVNLPGKVDARGWKELADLHLETLERAERIAAESGKRLEAGDGPAIGVISQQIMLEVPEYARPPGV